MKHIHIIYSNFDNERVKILAQHGIKVEAKYDRFDIEENEIYFALKPYLDKWNVEDFVITQFSDHDLRNAKRLVLLSPWANGYPMPDNENGYQATTYDNTKYCATCGIGLKQKEPFRLKKAPGWTGQKRMFSLNWAFDELFVRKDFYENLFKSIGIKSREVLLYKKDTVIEDTVQLIIPETEKSLNLEGHSYQTCKDCNRNRYDLINNGFFPPFKEEVDNLQFFKSKEWFGTGANARKYIFVSQELRQEFIKRKINANYIPCE